MKIGTKQARGVIEYGPDGNRRLHSIPRDEDIVLLLGLSRNGGNGTEKRLYGLQALCGTLRCNFGLFAAEGLNILVVNLCLLHARAKSLQVRPPPSPILLSGDFLGQSSNVRDLWSGCTHVSTIMVNVPHEKIVRGELSFPTRVLDVGDGSDSHVLRLSMELVSSEDMLP